jgi:signal transduction histidine kinase
MLTLRGNPSLALGIVVAASFIVLETLAVIGLKHLAPREAFETLFLLGVFVVSTGWGLGLAMTTSVVSAFALAYFRGWPAKHFMLFELGNGVVIVVFLVVALLTNFVAGLARARAVEADQRRQQADALAEQQSALRQVATQVARGAEPSDVFASVAKEMARCLHAESTALHRYQTDGSAVIVASYGAPESGHQPVPVGARLTLEGDPVSARVLRTGRAARLDRYDDVVGSAAAWARALGIRQSVGAPIVVGDRVWGAAVVASSCSEPLPADTEGRISDFADLVATAIANAATRAELIASRARIVAAADNARRRFERDLHDGAQQRLITLGLQLRQADESLPADPHAAKTRLAQIASGLTAVSADLREISRGIHPAILSRGGLGPAIKTLARRSVVPVKLDLEIKGPLPDFAQVTAYYVAAEALTNAAKHAQASEVALSAKTEEAALHLSIRDDGIGGADSRKGSGLVGLKDRLEAVGGRLLIESLPGSGTSMCATIPLADRPPSR